MDQQAFALLMNKIQQQDNKFDSIEEKLDDLLAWKWKLSGITLVVSSVIGIAVQFLINKLS